MLELDCPWGNIQKLGYLSDSIIQPNIVILSK